MEIDIRSISKKYGSTKALDGFSLASPGGRIIAVIGLNGAGKSTLLRCLAGIAAPRAGEIRYGGEPFTRARLDLRRRLAFMPDVPVCYAAHHALRHIALMLKVYGIPADEELEERIMKVLGDLDLLEIAEQPLGQLSRGQIYKATLAAHDAVRPDLWLLDEPFASGMDPQGNTTLKKLARKAAAEGRTVVYTTQILEIAETFADELVVIDRGRTRHRFNRGDLEAMPGQGPGSLEAILGEFRDVPA